MPERVTRVVPHLAAAVLFAGLAVALTWPLAIHVREGMLGAGVGDNATFVWNFWWIKKALAEGHSPFWTSALFAPIGTSLVLHTMTLLPTAAATAVLAPIEGDPLVVHNVAVIATLFLNGLCAYGAAYALTREPAAAIVGGLIFAASPFLTARLQGHFNVLSAWGLPLLVMALVRYARRASAPSALLVACALAALAYTDYYHFVFGAVLAPLYLLLQHRRLDVTSMPLTPARRWTLRGLLAIALSFLAAISVIASNGGNELTIAGLHVRAQSTFNLRGALWMLALVAMVVWRWPRVRLVPNHAAQRDSGPPQPWSWRSIAAGAVALVVLVLPLIVEAARLIANNDYASQTYLWRSAPPGIDVGALLLGNPFHPLYGSLVRAAYARLGIDAVEGVAWLGIVPVVYLVLAATRLRAQAEVRRWMLVAALFFLWALGPYLVVFGANTGFMLPQTLLRVVPLVANARIPGRAFVMVILGVALMASLAIASGANVLRTRTTASRLTLAGLAALLVLIDYWPTEQAFVPLDRPALYQTLRSLPSGPVLDLPLGIRDGFGERGHLDHRALFYQTLHEHPLAGGFVGRLSPRVRYAYERDPVLGALLSDGIPGGSVGASTTAGANVDSLACAFRYVVLPKTSTAATRDVVNRVFQLERLAGDDARELFRVTSCRARR